MTRTLFCTLLPVLLIAACGKATRGSYDYPKKLGSRWDLVMQESLSPSTAPEAIRTLTILNVWRAKYKGDTGSATVTIYETPASVVAFEVLQKWRHEKGQVTFHQGIDFVVVESPEMTMQAMESMSNAIATTLSGRGK